MNRNVTVTIYNNEGMLFDTDHRYIIRLNPRTASIEYDLLKGPAHTKSLMYAKDFCSIVQFLLEALDSSLGAQSNCHRVFYDIPSYVAWRRDADFTDADVAWYVLLEYPDDRRVMYLSTDFLPAPAELDQIELLVKEALELV